MNTPENLTVETVKLLIEKAIVDDKPHAYGQVSLVQISDTDKFTIISITIKRPSLQVLTIKKIGMLFGEENVLVSYDFYNANSIKLLICKNKS